MQVVLRIRKQEGVSNRRTQEGVSNRRTKTTKIKITDSCFIS